jgi:hypothetical protein
MWSLRSVQQKTTFSETLRRFGSFAPKRSPLTASSNFWVPISDSLEWGVADISCKFS